ncbi:uncharacterized protein M421DRAFT_421606 [Didymella exigua CBS 183.55]|uniref:Uncharacterized protein n=1 Tax=Didymella exigua CBS 183.55 TaxID=1150837 RepID=A0A6A5RN33_9PLEO|nr:uncharacterized protein M421DRAFT_421606 [Didymella exigua CBS 183.55]KAF1927766.1 hypothetical protein M421DRAFT_421606 [Didymella exigua CBS 183.55]
MPVFAAPTRLRLVLLFVNTLQRPGGEYTSCTNFGAAAARATFGLVQYASLLSYMLISCMHSIACETAQYQCLRSATHGARLLMK